MTMTIQGKFKKQLNVVERSNFKSRKVWITTEDNPQYPQTIELEVNQDKVDMFSGVSEGAPVTCHVNLRGREWVNKEGVTVVFNSIVCWKIEAGSVLPDNHQAASTYVPPTDEQLNDLPF
jgi:hypothetical protein